MKRSNIICYRSHTVFRHLTGYWMKVTIMNATIKKIEKQTWRLILLSNWAGAYANFVPRILLQKTPIRERKRENNISIITLQNGLARVVRIKYVWHEQRIFLIDCILAIHRLDRNASNIHVWHPIKFYLFQLQIQQIISNDYHKH